MNNVPDQSSLLNTPPIPYVITGNTKADIFAIENTIYSLRLEMDSLKEALSHTTVGQPEEKNLTKKFKSKLATVQELTFILDVISIPKKYPYNNRILSEAELDEVLYQCNRLHQECVELVKYGESERTLLDSADFDAEDLNQIRCRASDTQLVIKSILYCLDKIYYSDYYSSSANTYKTEDLTEESESAPEHIEEKTASNDAERQSRLPSFEDVLKLFVVILFFSTLTLLASNRDLRAEISQANSEHEDEYYNLESQYNETLDDLDDSWRSYDELLSYAEMLEEDNARLERDLEDAMDILDELESYGYYY